MTFREFIRKQLAEVWATPDGDLPDDNEKSRSWNRIQEYQQGGIMLEDIQDEIRRQTKEQTDFIVNKIRRMPHVFEVKHTNERGVLLELKPAKRMYFITFLGAHPEGSLNYPDALTERIEGPQPHCGIGSYNVDTDVKEAAALADEGKASWHVTSPGVPIDRAIEEIIKLDYGMRVFGCFIS